MQNSPYDQQGYRQPPNSGQGNSSTGLQPNIAALISYLISPITSIVFLVLEKENRFVRFHAMQSLLFGVAIIVLSIAVNIVMTILIGVIGSASNVLGSLLGLLWMLLWLALMLGIFVGWVLCLVKSYQGQTFKLPFIGDMAERMVNK